MLAQFREQPRAFYMIFLLEIWERFGFYTVQGILTLYFIRFLKLSEQDAYFTFGAFSALVYGMVVVGGYLGDKVLGAKRTLLLGLLTLALGYLSLALAEKQQIFFALGLICVGNGLFKANPASLLAKCYEKHDPRLHGGYTLYYMAVNLGSIVALFLGPLLSAHYGYSYAFFASFIGILLGLANYFFQRQHIAFIHSPADEKKLSLWVLALTVVGIVAVTALAAYLLQHVMIAKKLVFFIIIVVVMIYFFVMRGQQKKVVLRMLVAFILMLEAVVFFTLYQQMPTSINLFAVNNVHPNILGISLDPQSFQVLNPIWIITLSPILAKIYDKFYRRGISFLIPQKFALGMTFCGLSFMVLYFSRYLHDDYGMVSSWWLVGSYLLQALGELLVSALGLAMVAELVPPAIAGFVMGMWFLASASAGFMGATVASFTALPKNLSPSVDTLMLYTQVFAYVGGITLCLACVLWLTSPYLIRLMGDDFSPQHRMKINRIRPH